MKRIFYKVEEIKQWAQGMDLIRLENALKVQKGSYTFYPRPVAVSIEYEDNDAYERIGRRIFMVSTLTFHEDEYNPSFSASGFLIEPDGVKRTYVIDSLEDHLLPGEAGRLADDIPEEYIDFNAVEKGWKLLGRQSYNITTDSGKTLRLSISPARKFIIDTDLPGGGVESGISAMLSMNRILAEIANGSTIEETLKKYVESTNMDLPF